MMAVTGFEPGYLRCATRLYRRDTPSIGLIYRVPILFNLGHRSSGLRCIVQ